jgi:hypothetical protein
LLTTGFQLRQEIANGVDTVLSQNGDIAFANVKFADGDCGRGERCGKTR